MTAFEEAADVVDVADVADMADVVVEVITAEAAAGVVIAPESTGTRAWTSCAARPSAAGGTAQAAGSNWLLYSSA